MNFSSLSERPALVHAQKSGLHAKAAKSLLVPLKVFNVLNNPEWIDYLVKETPIEDYGADWHGYQYWQTITIMDLQKVSDLSQKLQQQNQ